MFGSKLRALARGRQSEQLAERHLKAQGLSLVERNYLCAQGEIDLVMRDDDCLVFVEVRHRSNDKFGSAIESVTKSKQRKLTAAARHFIIHRGLSEQQAMRFDVVGVSKVGAEEKVAWIANAFYGV